MESNDLNQRLMRAIRPGQLDEVRTLLESGANPNFVEPNWGHTPLHKAAKQNCPDICRLLLESGADVHAVDIQGESALHAAAVDSEAEVCRILVAAGARWKFAPEEITSFNRLTPFQMAVDSGYSDTVRFFVNECGEDPNQRTVGGKTMLQLASKRDKVKILLKSLKTEFAVRQAAPTDDASGEVTVRASIGRRPL